MTSRNNLPPEAGSIPHRLIDTLREGKAPPIILRKGAEGILPVSLNEKIEILVILSQGSDEDIRNKALATLSGLDPADLRQVFANPETPVAVLEFAAHHLAPARKELVESLLANPSLPDSLLESLQGIVASPAPLAADEDSAAADGEEQDGEPSSPERQTLLQKINQMTAPEKINAALLGSQEERLLLVRDANKTVARAVLQSPKLSDQEIENIAMMKSVTEEILRLIALNRKFIRNYGVVRNLINNPRTPVDVGLPLIHRLNDRDLKDLSRNKNVAEVLRSMALRMIKQKEEANKPKIPGKH